MNIKQLSPNGKNPRKISKHKLTQLAKSMIEHGPLDGFIYNVRTKRLAGGHQRQAVMPEDARVFIEKRYEKTTPQGTIASGYVDYMGERWPYREVDWDESKEKAANIAANKGAGEWDLPKLQEFVLELDNENFDLDLTMFDSDELKDLFGKDFGADKSKEAIEDDVPEVPKEPISKLGDLYELGEHRLMCGDSTDKATIERLMNGEKADLVFTDPPYGMGLDTDYSKMGNTGLKHKQGMVDEFKPELINAILSINCDETFIFGADYFAEHLPNRNNGSFIVWDKRSNEKENGITDGQFGSDFELCWSKSKHKRELAIILRPTGYYAARTDDRACHPTQKPIALAEWFLNKWSKSANTILDLFGGSGSTLIACEKTKRKCFMMELDPHYIDVIVSRWCKYTGKTEIKRNGEPMTWNINTTST